MSNGVGVGVRANHLDVHRIKSWNAKRISSIYTTYPEYRQKERNNWIKIESIAVTNTGNWDAIQSGVKQSRRKLNANANTFVFLCSPIDINFYLYQKSIRVFRLIPLTLDSLHTKTESSNDVQNIL